MSLEACASVITVSLLKWSCDWTIKCFSHFFSGPQMKWRRCGMPRLPPRLYSGAPLSLLCGLMLIRGAWFGPGAGWWWVGRRGAATLHTIVSTAYTCRQRTNKAVSCFLFSPLFSLLVNLPARRPDRRILRQSMMRSRTLPLLCPWLSWSSGLARCYVSLCQCWLWSYPSLFMSRLTIVFVWAGSPSRTTAQRGWWWKRAVVKKQQMRWTTKKASEQKQHSQHCCFHCSHCKDRICYCKIK